MKNFDVQSSVKSETYGVSWSGTDLWQHERNQDHDGDDDRIPDIFSVKHCMKIVFELARLDEIMPSVDGKEAAVEEKHVNRLYKATYERIEHTGELGFFDRSWKSISRMRKISLK